MSMMASWKAILLIFFLGSLRINCQSSSTCIYDDPYSSATLDLSAFKGEMNTLTTTYGETFKWDICENLINANGSNTMLAGFNSHGTCDCIYAYAGDVYSIMNRGTQWEIQYWTNNNSITTSMEFIWKCDHSVSTYHIDNYNLQCGADAGTNYVQVSTSAACAPTPPPTTCVWLDKADTSHYLDLRNIKGDYMVWYPNASEYRIGYVYYICLNGQKCDSDGVNNMAEYLNTYNTPQCQDYMAVWDNGVSQPWYNVSGQQWEFRYENGESCNGYPTVLYTHWTCDPNVSYHWANMKQLSSCIWLFEFTSKYACV